jgi:pimeloyl-ACP methyl ester carboxylesterase
MHRLPAGTARHKDNRQKQGHIERVDVGLGSPLVAETWGEGDRLVYLVHGWGGWRGQVSAFVQPLVEAGFKVIAADCLSHGDSPPGRYGPGHTSGNEMIDCFAGLVARLGQPYGAIAHSLGCGCVCRALADGSVTAERLVMVAPNPDMAANTEQFGRSLGFRASTRRLLFKEVEQYAGRPMSDFDLTLLAASGCLPKGLIIHDQSDREAPYEGALAMKTAWPDAELITTEGYGHHRILITPSVVRAAVEFMAS